jgi:hypothetical protein
MTNHSRPLRPAEQRGVVEAARASAADVRRAVKDSAKAINESHRLLQSSLPEKDETK